MVKGCIYRALLLIYDHSKLFTSLLSPTQTHIHCGMLGVCLVALGFLFPVLPPSAVSPPVFPRWSWLSYTPALPHLLLNACSNGVLGFALWFFFLKLGFGSWTLYCFIAINIAFSGQCFLLFTSLHHVTISAILSTSNSSLAPKSPSLHSFVPDILFSLRASWVSSYRLCWLSFNTAAALKVFCAPPVNVFHHSENTIRRHSDAIGVNDISLLTVPL